MVTREWDAAAYDRLPLPHVEWGRRVINRMRLGGHERVLDAGCGTGRDGAALLERFPGVHLIGVDGSATMIEQARHRLGAHAELLVADLTQPLPIEPVDAIMSVAAFHWIDDHAGLFANLAASTLPGGRLTSDCGGQGQLTYVDEAVAAVTGRPNKAVRFAGVDETTTHLKAAGFEPEDVRLRPDPLRLEDPDLMEAYLAAVILGAYLDGMTAADGRALVGAVRAAMREPVIDYVRLEIDAVRGKVS